MWPDPLGAAPGANDQDLIMTSPLLDPRFKRVFGTFPLKQEALAQALQCAIDTGYRAVDTAQMYKNEADVGETLAHCGVARDDLCIVTKVHPDNFAPERFMASVEQSLKDLRVSQVDVLLLHWPPKGEDVAPSLKQLDLAAREGLAKHVGVSNYTSAMMRTAQQTLSVPVAANQVEFHPLLDQSKLLATSAELGIPLMAYCAAARGKVLAHPEFGDIAQHHGKTAMQVALRWVLQKGVATNTMSTQAEHIRANFEIDDFSLSDDEMQTITALNATGLRIVNDQIVPWAPRWDA
jgi:2,5-diketo-D-gluconate reductase B